MSDNSTNAPAPSKLILLSELPRQSSGAKVRFLACIRDCDETSALLYVEHRYPQTATPFPTVVVNYDLLKETANREILQIGAWVNIIGYIRGKTTHARRQARTETSVEQAIDVQAILIWSAGAIRISEYEDALEKMETNRG